MNHSVSKRRSGYTLIEIMVTMSIGTVVMTVAALWIHQSMKTASIMRQRERQHQSLLSVAASLRDHVRRSDTIAMHGDQELRLRMANDEQVSFRITPTSIQMLQTQGGKVTQREAFRLTDRCTANWDASEMPNWITLVVLRQPPFARQPQRPGQSQRNAQRIDAAKQIETPVPVELIVRTAPVHRQHRDTAEPIQ